MNEMKDKSRIKQLINDFKSCRYCCLRIIEINQKLEVMNHMILGLSHSVQNLSREQEKSNLPMPKYNKHYTSPVAMLYEIEKLENEVNYYRRRIMECKPVELLSILDQNILFDLYFFNMNSWDVAEKYGYSRKGLYKHINTEIEKLI